MVMYHIPLIEWKLKHLIFRGWRLTKFWRFSLFSSLSKSLNFSTVVSGKPGSGSYNFLDKLSFPKFRCDSNFKIPLFCSSTFLQIQHFTNVSVSCRNYANVVNLQRLFQISKRLPHSVENLLHGFNQSIHVWRVQRINGLVVLSHWEIVDNAFIRDGQIISISEWWIFHPKCFGFVENGVRGLWPEWNRRKRINVGRTTGWSKRIRGILKIV